MAIGSNPLSSTFGLEKLHKLLRNNRPSEGLAELRALEAIIGLVMWSLSLRLVAGTWCVRSILIARRPPNQGGSLLDMPGNPCTIPIMATPGRRLRKTLPSKTTTKRPVLRLALKFILSFAMGFGGNA
jgi:hypothetical protein